MGDTIVPSDFVSATSLLRSLIAARKLLKDSLTTEAVSVALKLAGKGASFGSDQERLEAVSILGKAAEISKPVAARVRPLLKEGLQSSLPHIGSWGTADDRYYLAKGVTVSDALWVREYAAVELAKGDVAEIKSREVWADLAVGRAENLAEALRAIARALEEDRRQVGYSVDTAARKMNRIAVALGDRIARADIPSGENFGESLFELILQAGGSKGPETRPLRQEIALTILNLVVQVLRFRFDAALDQNVYRVAGLVLGWWKPARPPGPIQTQADRIARLAMGALHTLARQGVSQKTIRQSLVSAFGVHTVNEIGTKIVENDPSLEPVVAAWLANGRILSETRSNVAVREISEQGLDELLARLLLSIKSEETSPQAMEMVADAIQLLEPTHALTIRTAAARARLAAQNVKVIAAKRRLSLLGEPGELVSYDPLLHDTNDDLQISARARIKVPGVVKELEDRPATVILKAQIEKP